MKSYTLVLTVILITSLTSCAQDWSNQKIDGYRGIWFELGQPYEYGDKYSGGLGTYTVKHRPLAIYNEKVNKTFFVYGGTTGKKSKHLLCMIGYYDHATGRVAKPTVVYDKQGVDDPHDNPSLLIDNDGYLWVFVSGRNVSRPGFKFKGKKPYDISSFVQITEEEMTYPQPWIYESGEMLHLFTKYTGRRELYYETSKNGVNWTEDKKLAGIRAEGHKLGGHYQVSAKYKNKVATFFNRHPNGNVDKRTDLYYLQTGDAGETWSTANSKPLEIPLRQVESPARIQDYFSTKKNVYLKDINFYEDGKPICLYLTSGGHEPGPLNSPREFRLTYWDGTVWQTNVVCETSHNYDMGSLFIEDDRWLVVVPSEKGPQQYGTGGEIVMWESYDKGGHWKKVKQVTANSPRNHGYVRRPEFAKNPFYFFWADGNADKMSISKMYFSDAEGNIRMLPYRMKEDFERPALMNNSIE